MGAEELLGLAERCEAGAEADRELDADIARAVGYRDINGDGSLWDRGNDGYWSISDFDDRNPPLLFFTASLDAAMSLVPEGCTWSAGDWSALGKEVGATCWPPEDNHPVDFRGITRAATPALALCAAALRARAAIIKENE